MKKILIQFCLRNLNSVRSVIVEGLLKNYLGKFIHVESAGVKLEILTTLQ